MSDAFIEVEEQLRQDRLLRMLRRWGPWALGAFAAVLAGVAGWMWWNANHAETAQAQAEQFAAAQELLANNELAAATEAFGALEQDGNSAYRTMAQMQLAGILVAQGDVQGAIAAFDGIAAAEDDPILRDTARIRAAYLVADTQDLPALEQRLAPLLEGDGPMEAVAKELLAVELWDNGQPERARELFTQIALDLDAPEDVRRRAEQLAQAVLGPPPETAATDAAGESGSTTAEPAETPEEGAAQ